jgi:hypothetical protein
MSKLNTKEIEWDISRNGDGIIVRAKLGDLPLGSRIYWSISTEEAIQQATKYIKQYGSLH